MPAEVVAPVAVKHIRRRAVEVRLVVERLPRDNGIARESHLVAMVAQAAPTVINHRSLICVLLHIGKETTAYPPCVFQRRHFPVVEMLLPIKPPETYTIAHHRIENDVKHAGHKLLVGRHPLNRLFSCRVYA